MSTCRAAGAVGDGGRTARWWGGEPAGKGAEHRLRSPANPRSIPLTTGCSTTAAGSATPVRAHDQVPPCSSTVTIHRRPPPTNGSFHPLYNPFYPPRRASRGCVPVTGRLRRAPAARVPAIQLHRARNVRCGRCVSVSRPFWRGRRVGHPDRTARALSEPHLAYPNVPLTERPRIGRNRFFHRLENTRALPRFVSA